MWAERATEVRKEVRLRKKGEMSDGGTRKEGQRAIRDGSANMRSCSGQLVARLGRRVGRSATHCA